MRPCRGARGVRDARGLGQTRLRFVWFKGCCTTTQTILRPVVHTLLLVIFYLDGPHTQNRGLIRLRREMTGLFNVDFDKLYKGTLALLSNRPDSHLL